MIEPEKRRHTMRGTRFNQEQIIAVLREAEAGVRLAELSRKYGICQATIYHWKAKYGDMTISEARRLKILEEENGRLKHIVAEQALEIKALKLVVSKNF
jgi:putative transposase